MLFFDGVCNLCNGTVRLLMRLDRKARLRFAPLQGETARALLPAELRETGMDGSLVLWMPSGTATLHRRSEGALEAVRLLGWPWKALAFFKLLPLSWRDGLYRWVARHRYRWFGRSETCRLPTAAERARFLD
ncbi:MAG: thiol-disulfide oxidoreductase DCC family protein [Opitutales bacterium]